MKLLAFLLLAVIFSSCLTANRVKRNCDLFAELCIAETQKTVEYRDTTIYKLDTIRYPLPKDTLYRDGEVKIINGNAYIAPIYEKQGLINVEAYIKNNNIRVKAWLDDTLYITKHDTIRIQGAIKTEKIHDVVIQEKKYVPVIYKIALWLMIIEILAIIVFLILAKYADKAVNIFKKLFS